MKEKQPYEKPKMTFVENQPERRKSLKKEKIVPVRFTNWHYECLQNEAREHGYGANISGYIRSQVLVDHTTPQLSKEIRKCEYQINRIVNNIKQCKNSIYVTKEEWDFQCGSDALRIQMCDHFKTTGAYRSVPPPAAFYKKRSEALGTAEYVTDR